MKTDRRQAAHNELVTLTQTLRTNAPHMVTRLTEWMSGYPTGGTTSPQQSQQHDDECPQKNDPAEPCTCEGTPIDYTDRTGDLATRPDTHRKELNNYDKTITSIVNQLKELHRTQQNTINKGKTETQQPAPCKSCARIPDHHGQPTHTPAHRDKLGLCRWCLDWHTTHGAWPPIPILTAHHRGQRITPLLEQRLTRNA